MHFFLILKGNTKYKNYGKLKLVPILIGKTFKETQYNSIVVRLHSNEDKQNRMISLKKHRREIILQSKNPKTIKQLKQGESYVKCYGEDIKVNDKVVLSNQGFANVIVKELNKSRGQYWKKVLKKRNLIKTKRQFKIIKKMSYNDYLNFKKYYNDYDFGKYTYIRGALAEETAQSFTCKGKISSSNIKVESPIKKVKPLSYLEFDFIAWCQNNPNGTSMQ